MLQRDRAIRNYFGILLTVALFYAVMGGAIYSEVFAHGIFMFDDHDYVINNPLIQAGSLLSSLTDPRYIGYLTFAFNSNTFGGDPRYYHLFNITIHICNSFLVFLLTAIICRYLWRGDGSVNKRYLVVSFITGLLFLIHPMSTQAVSYITQRFTSLCTFFYLLSTVCYLYGRARFEKRLYLKGVLLHLLAFISALFAMKTKEIAFTMPFMLCFFEFILFSRSRFAKKRFLFLIPFLATLLIIPLSLYGPELGLTNYGDGVAEATRRDKIFDLTKRSPYEYCLTQFRVIVVYLRLLLIPVGQRVVYDLKASTSFMEPAVIGSFLLLISIVAYGIYSWITAKREDEEGALDKRIIAIGVLWFFVTISIESSFIAIKDLIFEHRAYLPSIGFYMVMVIVVGRISSNIVNRWGKSLIPYYLFFIVTITLAILTFQRNKIWFDEMLFWEQAVKDAPTKPIVYHNRAFAHVNRRELGPAIRDFNKTMTFFSGHVTNNLQWDEGDLSPYNMSKAYTNRGNVYTAIGDEPRALEDYKKAKEVLFNAAAVTGANDRRKGYGTPQHLESLAIFADSYAKRGFFAEAAAKYGEILSFEPDNLSALVNRGNMLARTGNYKAAILDYNLAILLQPDYALAYYNRAISFVGVKKIEDAIKDFETACSMGVAVSCTTHQNLLRTGNM
jgi:tetratricopeptide (TPR) repeat protein